MRLKVRLIGIAIGLLIVGATRIKWTKDPYEKLSDNARTQFTQVINEYGALVPVNLDPAEVTMVRGRKLLVAQGNNALVIHDGEYRVPPEFAETAEEVGVVVFVTEERDRDSTWNYQGKAKGYGSWFTFTALARPEKKLIAQWKRYSLPPASMFVYRNQAHDQYAYVSTDEARTDGAELFAGRLPKDAVGGAQVSQKGKASAAVDRSALVIESVKAAAAMQKGDYPEAERILRKVVAEYEAVSETEPERLRQANEQLAGVLVAQDKHGEAAAQFERVLKLLEQRFGPEGKELLPSLNSLAEERSLENRPDEAAAAYERVRALLEKLGEADGEEYALTLRSLGMAKLDGGKPAEAEALLTRALKLQEELLDPMDSELADTLDDCAKVATARG
ncbi:MAG: tetratricopeptide repeat protein [Myxococcaceae bacterium]